MRKFEAARTVGHNLRRCLQTHSGPECSRNGVLPCFEGNRKTLLAQDSPAFCSESERLRFSVDELAGDLPVTIHNTSRWRCCASGLMLVLLHQALCLTVTMPRLLCGLRGSLGSFFQCGCNIAGRGSSGRCLTFFRLWLTWGRTLPIDSHWI
ncbi:hypothetical protein EMIT0P294_180044 [Pseudomonas sp. IT-P294]